MIQEQNDRIRIPDSATETVSRDAEIAELREAYENWKAFGEKANSVLLDIWHTVTPHDTKHMTYGDDPAVVLAAFLAQSSSLVATREAIARQLHQTACGCADWQPGDREDTQYDDMAKALIASGVVREVGDERIAEAYEDAAEMILALNKDYRETVGLTQQRGFAIEASAKILRRAAAIRGGEKE